MSVVDAGEKRERTEQDRNGALQTAPGDEDALAPREPGEEEEREHASGRATNARIRRRARDRRPRPILPRSPRPTVSPRATNAAISASPASDERKPSISPLRGAAASPRMITGDEHREEARTSDDRREPVDEPGAGEYADRIQSRSGEPDVTHHGEKDERAGDPDARPERHLDGELLHDDREVPSSSVASSIIPIMSAMPTGSFIPASPSRIVPARPRISREPKTENVTAGSVGAIAEPMRPARIQSNPSRCALRARRTRRSRMCRARRARRSGRRTAGSVEARCGGRRRRG